MTELIGKSEMLANEAIDYNLLQTIHLVNSKKNKLLNINYIVSHNLKNHISNISSLVQMKDSGIIDNEEFFNYMTSISKELTPIITNLEELVSLQNLHNSTKNQELNLNENLNKVFSILFDELSINKIQINNQVPDDFSIQFNKSYLESILLNLISNTIKFSDQNKLSFIDFSVDFIDGYKVVIIKDNGIGFDVEKYKEDIFGLYKTFHLNSNSMGIGLYVTKNQMEEMDGRIEVESKVNEGTTFKLYFKN